MKITKKHIGYRVWSFMFGWGTIKDVNDMAISYPYPVEIKFDNGNTYVFSLTGTYNNGEPQTLFWDKLSYAIPKDPLEREIVKVERWGVFDGELLLSAFKTDREAREYISGACTCEEIARVRLIKLTGEYEVD